MSKGGLLYAICAEGTALVKIGYTRGTLRRTLPIAWVVLGIGLMTLAFVAWSTVQLVREGRLHHARMLEGHQVPRR